MSKVQFFSNLRNIKAQIKTGNMPAKVLDKKDEYGKGI